MKRTLGQNRELHVLLAKNGIDADTKKEMVHNHTDGRTIKSSEMMYNECQNLIHHLKHNSPEETRSDKMRKKIISLFRKQGYTLHNGKADMLAIESWTEKYGYLKKPLNSYKYNELPKLVTQAENMYHSFLKTI